MTHFLQRNAGLLMLIALSACSGGSHHGNPGSSSGSEFGQSDGSLRPTPALAGQVEVGAGIAGTSNVSASAASATALPLRSAVLLAGSSLVSGAATIGITDLEKLGDAIPGDARIAPWSTANPADILGRSAPNNVNPANNIEAVRIRNADGRPFATGKWSKAFFYQNPTRLDAYFQGKPVADPRNLDDSVNRSVFAFPNKLWLDDRIGMVHISFPKRPYVPVNPDADAVLYDLSSPYKRDYVLYSMEPDAREDMRLGYFSDGAAVLPRQIDRFDELTVATSWKSADGARAMQLIAAEGSPYVTVRYQGLRPMVQHGYRIQAARERNAAGDDLTDTLRYDDWENINQLVAVASDDAALQEFVEFGSAPAHPTLSGTRFRFVYDVPELGFSPANSNDGRVVQPQSMYKEAVLYASSPITLEWNATRRSYVASAVFNGTLRAAYVDGTPKTPSLETTHGLGVSALPTFIANRATLDRHAQAYPLSSEIRLQYDGGATASLSYKWLVQRLDESTPAAGELMMMGFDLTHLPSLSTPQTAALNYPSNFGRMSAVLGDEWRQIINIPAMLQAGATENQLWYGQRTAKPADYADLRAALLVDTAMMKNNIAHCNYESYLCGKYLHNISRATLIAAEIGALDIRNDMLAFLKQTIQPWFDGVDPNDPTYANNPIRDNFLYDTTNGGVITERGLKTYSADYYNSAYTDHMYHYGYYIYAAAVLGKYDTAWLDANREKVNTLVRDIANPSLDDPWFPLLRTYDWFRLQNFADSGPSAHGPNTESSTESIHANYALMLWSVLNRKPEFQALAAVMTAAEIRSAQAFYQITPDTSPFREVTVPTVTVRTATGPAALRLDPSQEIATGIVFQGISQMQIYFGEFEYLRVGIQLLPFSGISDAVFSRKWARTHEARLGEMERRQTAQFNAIINTPPNPSSPCFLANYGGGDVNPGAVCATALQVLYSWRAMIASANGLNSPEKTYLTYRDYSTSLQAQETLYQNNTMPSKYPGSSLSDGGIVADVRKSMLTPSIDSNVLWWLSTQKP